MRSWNEVHYDSNFDKLGSSVTPAAIAALKEALPDIFDISGSETTWPDQILDVSIGSDLWEEIEDDLYNQPDDPDPLRDRPDDLLFTDDYIAVEAALIAGEDLAGYGEAAEITKSIQDHFGGDWPGAPVGNDQPQRQSPTGRQGFYPSPELLAFYLPWHQFGISQWGIYILVSGVTALGRDIFSRCPNILSRADAYRAAQLFLYHHEAYHNAVEAFSARIEVSHRKGCYLSGVKACASSLLPASQLHEEGLANAYAHGKVRTMLFKQVPEMSAARKHNKRVAAALALRSIFTMQAPAYASAERILTGAVSFGAAEQELQETCHGKSGLGIPGASPGIWLGAPRAMSPSLSRDKRFSYIVTRNNPIVRHAANVPQYSRREMIRRMHVVTGGWETGGGKHPKFVLPDGKRIPVPKHGHNDDLARGTARKILREAGIRSSLEHFMSAKDKELQRGATNG